MTDRVRLGDMLIAAGLVSRAQVQEALEIQKKTGQRFGETLVALGYVAEAQMTQMLSNQLSIPWVNLYHVDFSRELLDLIPADLAEHYELIPVYVRSVRRQGDTLYVAMTDPLSLDSLQLVADESGLPVKPMVANPSDIRNAIRVYYLGLPPQVAPAPTSGPADPVDVDTPGLDASDLESLPPSEPAPADRESRPPVEPSIPPTRPPASFLTLTLLDGTTVRLPSPSGAAAPDEPAERGLTTRDLIGALNARAAGEDVDDILPQGAWEPLFASLLSILLRKGLVADWEFVDEWKKQRAKWERE